MVYVNSLLTKIEGNKDLLHIYLTNKQAYRELLNSEEYQIPDMMIRYLASYKISHKESYIQNRMRCLKEFNSFCVEEKNKKQVEHRKQRVEALKHQIVDSEKLIEINSFTDRPIPEIPIDILDIFLLDKKLYQKIILSPKIRIQKEIVEFLDKYTIIEKYYENTKRKYIEKGSAYLLAKRILGIISEKERDLKRINNITDKIADDIDLDILDIFMHHKKLFKELRKTQNYEMTPLLAEFFQKYSTGKLQTRNYYIEKYEEYLKIKKKGSNAKTIKINKLTDMISIENKDILTLFLKNRDVYDQVCKMKNYEINEELRNFIETYNPKSKKYSKKQKVEYINAYKEYLTNQKGKKERKWIEQLLVDTKKRTINWRKRRWKKNSQFLEQDFISSCNGHEYLLSVIGKCIEQNKWKVHITLEIDGKSNEKISKEIKDVLYQEVLKSITAEEQKQQEEKKKQLQEKIRYISSDDFVIRTNIFKCISEHHHLEEVLGVIQVLKSDGTTVEEKVTAAYCSECGCYFLMRSEYERIAKRGILICKMIEKEDFYKHSLHFPDMAGESILMQNGYNVKANVGLTDIQRQTILANLMDNHVLSASQIISYLQMFKTQKMGLPAYKMAVDKWDADLQFTRLYKENNKRRVFINSITKTVYQKK